MLGEVVDPSRGDVPARVAAERVPPDQHRVDEQYGAADADAERSAEVEPEGGVPGQDAGEDDREVPRIPVDVLADEREARLARVGLVRLGHGTRRRGQPE